ncbi:MAG: amidohydrolase family protein [Xanthomonadales bacterium]|nr:amidohydrolase family protein [Xanthomonadales bacterium]
MRCSLTVFLIAMSLALVLNMAQADTLAITGATIIDGTGADPLRKGTVLVENGRIAAVGRSGDVAVPDGARVIDGKGKFVIPGLMDANLHLFLNLDTETLIKYEDRYDEIIVEAAQITLKSGLTTVFDTWGPRAALVKARDTINAGEVPGSRIYLAGNIIGFDGPLSADFRGDAAAHFKKSVVKRINDTWEEGTGRRLTWMGPDEVADVVKDYATRDMDFLKYGSSGHTEMSFISFSGRVQKAIVDAGHDAGMTVQVHTTSVESLDMAIEAGVDILTHCEITGPTVGMPDETVGKLVERQIPCSVLPVTKRRIDALKADKPSNFLVPFMVTGRANTKKMIDAGAILLLSTDAGIEHPVMTAESEVDSITVDQRTAVGEGHFNALVGFEEMGMDPMEILKSTTSHIARAYQLDDEIGTVEPGKIADLVILSSNPLKSATNYRTIDTVIKSGNIVDRDALPLAPLISNQVPPEPTEE